jgi:hypothetical protein
MFQPRNSNLTVSMVPSLRPASSALSKPKNKAKTEEEDKKMID